MKRHSLRNLAWVFLAVAGSTFRPALATTVSIQPAIVSTALDSFFDVFVNIDDATDLYAFQFNIDFDPLILSAAAITEGPFLPSWDSTFFVPGTIDDDAGTIALTAGTLIGPVSGASGSGSLAKIRFKAISAGTSIVNLSDVILLDSSLIDLAASTANGSVNVTNIAGVPEPMSVMLFGIGLAGLAAGRLKGRSPRIRSMIHNQ